MAEAKACVANIRVSVWMVEVEGICPNPRFWSKQNCLVSRMLASNLGGIRSCPLVVQALLASAAFNAYN